MRPCFEYLGLDNDGRGEAASGQVEITGKLVKANSGESGISNGWERKPVGEIE